MSVILASLINNKEILEKNIKNIFKYKNKNYPKSLKFYDDKFAINFLFNDNGSKSFFVEKNKFLICFNGSILGSKKKNFLTAQDLLNLYKKKKDFLKYLNGFYSIVIYDIKKKKLLLIRDHAGVKNLFYKTINNGILITNYINVFYKSKLQKFLPDTNNYLEHIIHGNIVGGDTIHHHIKELPAAHFLEYKKKIFKLKEFWNYKNKFKKKNLHQNILRFDRILKNVVNDWVPKKKNVSILLSGGVDSSLISKLIYKKNTNINFYTAIFDKKYNYNEVNLITKENQKIKDKHKFIKIGEKAFGRDLIQFIKHTSHPITNFNGIVTNLICKHIQRKKKSNIVFCGEGSDELFSGFYRYYEIATKYQLSKKIKDLIMSNNSLNVDRFKFLKKDFKYKIPSKRKEVANEIYEKIPIKKYLILDQKTYAPPYFDRLDQSSFINGIDIRPIFMDKRIMEFSQQLRKDEYSILLDNKILTKVFLRKYSEKYLPKNISYPSFKGQLMIPTSNWFFKGILKNLFLKYFKKNTYFSKNFNIKKLFILFNQQRPERQKKYDHSTFFERILSYEIWLKLMNRNKK